MSLSEPETDQQNQDKRGHNELIVLKGLTRLHAGLLIVA